jgi:phosphotransacetylase
MKDKAIDKLANEIKQDSKLKKSIYADIIVEQLVKHMDQEPSFIDKVLNEEKSLKQCGQYLYQRAKEKKNKLKAGNTLMVSDNEVFGWAIHYFDEPNKNLNLTKVKETSKKVTKKTKTPKKIEVKESPQLSLFDL